MIKKNETNVRKRDPISNNTMNKGYYSKGSYGNYSENPGRGFNNGNRKFAASNKPLNSSVCKQWNFGSCTYGEKCNSLHECGSFAEAEKVGKQHRASSQENFTKPTQSEQRP